MLEPLYTAAEMFVFPSIYEGFGLPVAEAMATGLPVVATSADGVRDVVADGRVATLHRNHLRQEKS